MVAQPPFSINELWSHDVATPFELGQLSRESGLRFEFCDADWGERGNDRKCCPLVCHPVGSAAERREADDGNPDGAHNCPPHRWFLSAGIGVNSLLLFAAVRRGSAWEGSGFFACSAPFGAG
jgi:hypothetical protein